MRILSAAVTATLVATPAAAQLQITEVLFDPVGPDAGNQIVEIQNTSSNSFTPTGWTVCAPFRYDSLPPISIPAGGVVKLHIGVNGGSTATDFFLPNFATRPLNPTSDTFLIYQSSSFHIDADIVDFVSWGGGSSRRSQAENIGQWPMGGVSVGGPFTEGHSIAYSGSGDGPESWYRDATPTIGTANGQMSTTTLGFACATSGGTPTMTMPRPAVEGSRDFAFELAGGVANAPCAVFIGSPTGGVPVFGCTLEVTPFAAVQRTMSALGQAEVPLPQLNGVGGITLAFQAFVLDASAPNGLFGASAGESITFGH